jgi:uncharacterized protein (DUF1015 family)
MSDLRPFRGLLYDVAVAGPLRQVSSPPYDTISDEQQRALMAESRFNVVHLEFNEKHAEAADREAKYAEAADALDLWRSSGVLRRDEEPAFYPYQMSFELDGEHRSITGVIGAVRIEPWGGSVIPHERTMEHQVHDRLGLLRRAMANLSPVYATYPGPNRPLAEHLHDVTAHPPVAEVTDETGVRHRLWRTREREITRWMSEESLLIADGHHRYTTGLRFKQEMNEQRGAGPWDDIMVFAIDAAAEDPPVLPIHRVLRRGQPRGVPGHAAASLDQLLSRVDDAGMTYGTVTASHDGLRYSSAALDGSPPVVAALHEQVLTGLKMGTDLSFTADLAEVEDQIRRGEGVCGYLLPATNASRIRAVIDSGGVLPQKSTFFWPKPRTGMVIRPLED